MMSISTTHTYLTSSLLLASLQTSCQQVVFALFVSNCQQEQVGDKMLTVVTTG